MIASFRLKVFEVKYPSSYVSNSNSGLRKFHLIMFFTLRILNFLKTMEWRVRESHGRLLHLTLYTQSPQITRPPR